MTKFFNKFKNSCFGPVLSPGLSRTTSYGFLAPCQNLEKTNDALSRKCPNRSMKGWTEGQTDPIS